MTDICGFGPLSLNQFGHIYILRVILSAYIFWCTLSCEIQGFALRAGCSSDSGWRLPWNGGATSLVVETEDGEPIGSWAWKPLGVIIGASVVFMFSGLAINAVGRAAGAVVFTLISQRLDNLAEGDVAEHGPPDLLGGHHAPVAALLLHAGLIVGQAVQQARLAALALVSYERKANGIPSAAADNVRRAFSGRGSSRESSPAASPVAALPVYPSDAEVAGADQATWMEQRWRWQLSLRLSRRRKTRCR